MNLACEAIPMIHDRVFMVTTIQHDAAGENHEAREKDEKNLQAFLAAVHKVTVENVAVGVRWQTVLLWNNLLKCRSKVLLEITL